MPPFFVPLIALKRLADELWLGLELLVWFKSLEEWIENFAKSVENNEYSFNRK